MRIATRIISRLENQAGRECIGSIRLKGLQGMHLNPVDGHISAHQYQWLLRSVSHAQVDPQHGRCISVTTKDGDFSFP